MNFKKITALVLAVLMLFSTLVGCRKIGETDSTSNVSSDVILNYSNVDIIDNESEPQSLVDATSEDESSVSSGSTDNSTSANSNADSSNNNNSGSSNNTPTNIKDVNDTNNNDDGGTDEKDTPSIPEETVVLSGNGTLDEPYEGYLSEDGTFLTNEIASGKSFFYNIRGIANKILTIDSQNAYVVYNGKTYIAENGKVSFFVESDAAGSEFVKIEFGNSGTTSEKFAVIFESLKGSYDSPEKISSIENSIQHSLADGNADGYVFQYTAEKDGVIRFYLLSDTSKGQLMVTNTRNSATRSTESVEEGEVNTDNIGTYVQLDVKKGDVIKIAIGIIPNKRNQYKATTIEFLLKYS